MMDIIERTLPFDTADICQAFKFQSADASVPWDVTILHEHTLDVWINDVRQFRLVCTPSNLVDLVLGRLISEGIIRGKADVTLLYICEQGTRAKIFLQTECQHHAPASSFETIPTCCTDNRIIAPVSSLITEPPPLQPIPWKPEWISMLADALVRDTPLYASTHSAHSSMLMQEGKILCCHEDLARHNAIDKAIGWSENAGINRRSCILFTSGRIPVDMAKKAIRAGMPVLVSKSFPTEQAVSLAKQYCLTILHISERHGLLRFA